jgi:hypothetical protein
MRQTAPPPRASLNTVVKKINVPYREMKPNFIVMLLIAQIPDTSATDGLHMRTLTAVLQGNITAIIKEKQQQTYLNK